MSVIRSISDIETVLDIKSVHNIYRLTSTTKYFDELGRIEVYGIEVRYGDIAERIEDISSKKEIVIILLQKLETGICSPLHFINVVEDFIIDQII